MAYRTSGVFQISQANVVQPLFGSWVTAVSPASGFAGPAGAALTLTLGTAQNSGNDAAQIFLPGERAWLVDPSATKFGGVHGEDVMIASILNNTVTLGPKTLVSRSTNSYVFTENSHVAGALGVGSYLIPKLLINNFLVQYEDGGTGPFLYLGNSMLMTDVLYRFFKIGTVSLNDQPGYYNAGMFSPGNPFDVSELWTYCAHQGDKYSVSLNID